MDTATAIIKQLLETEEPYIESTRIPRPQTVARLEAHRKRFDRGDNGSMSLTIGSRSFHYEDGQWYETVRRRNPAYWSRPRYYVIFGEMPEWKMLFCRAPMTLTQHAFQKSMKAIARNEAGRAVDWHDIQADGADEGLFNRRLSGKIKPNEAVYDIFADGTWKKLK